MSNHAVSDDLIHWTKTNDKLTFTPQEGYDPDDWRDPFVLRDEDNDQYMLILGARKKGPKTQQTGRTVKFVSKDLKNWKFEGDFWAPDLFTMHAGSSGIHLPCVPAEWQSALQRGFYFYRCHTCLFLASGLLLRSFY